MAINHSPTGSDIRPYSLTEADHQAVGRLIRSCAELEDIVGLYLSQLTDVPLGMLMVLLGRSSISSKLQITQQMAYARGAAAKAAYDECFGREEYVDLMRCRNTVAHGTVLGMSDGGGIAFEVNEHLGFEGTKLQVAVYAYPPDELTAFADMAETVLPQIVARRRTQPLGPRAGIARPRRGRKRRQRSSRP